MSKREFLLIMDELLENEPGTLNGAEALASIPRWDSLAVIGFIALLDQHFGANFPATKIMDCKTVDDLARLLEGRVTE